MDALHLKTGTPTHSLTKINNEELNSLTHMQVSSAILRFASPVFNETFTAGMEEAGGKRIQVRVAVVLCALYGLCMPDAFTAKKITLQSVSPCRSRDCRSQNEGRAAWPAEWTRSCHGRKDPKSSDGKRGKYGRTKSVSPFRSRTAEPQQRPSCLACRMDKKLQNTQQGD